MTRAFIDLHCHTSASFDSLARPRRMSSERPPSRGLTHLVVTDHDRIDGALAARDAAPAGLTVIVGEEIKTAEGDLIAAFLERAVAPGMSAAETVAAVREQGGLVGIPHPFDRMRGSCAPRRGCRPWRRWSTGSRSTTLGSSAAGMSKRPPSPGSTRLAGVAVSDAHSVLEVGVAYTALDGDPSTPAGLLAALASCGDRAGPGHVRRPPVDADRQGGEPAPGQRRILPGRHRMSGAGGPRRGSAGPSTDGCWDRARRTVRRDGGHPDPRPARRRCRARTTARPIPTCRSSSRITTDAERRARCRADVARAPPAPAANDHLDRGPAGDHRDLLLDQRRAAQDRARARARREPCARPAGLHRVLRWASRSAAGAGRSCCAARGCGSAPRTPPRSSSCRGWSTASSRRSSATSTAPTC